MRVHAPHVPDTALFPLAEIFFCRSACCLSGQMGGRQLHRQTVQLGQNFKGLKIPLGQAYRDAYLLFRYLCCYVIALSVSLCPQDLYCPSAGTGRYRRMPVCRPGLACRPSSNIKRYPELTVGLPAPGFDLALLYSVRSLTAAEQLSESLWSVLRLFASPAENCLGRNQRAI
jgi:hypothetical protein